MVDRNILMVFLFAYNNSKILFEYSRNIILNHSQSIIKVHLSKIKVLTFQLINKSLINLVLINILIFLTIVLIFHAVLKFYKAGISSNIAYKSAMIENCLVMDILLEVYIII